MVGERTAIVWEVVWAISQKMPDQGRPDSADIVEVCADLCLRMQDWVHARGEDVVNTPGYGASLLLGRGDRGETTKKKRN